MIRLFPILRRLFTRQVRFVDYIEASTIHLKNRNKFLRIAILMREFERDVGRTVYTDSFDAALSRQYLLFLKRRKPERQKADAQAYRQNTVRGFICTTINLLSHAAKKGCRVQTDALRSCIPKREDSDAIALTMEEIYRILTLGLRSRRDKQIRDLFVIGCCTALRYSDYTRLTEANFTPDGISVLTRKTHTPVIIPIHPFVQLILNRNKGYDFLEYAGDPGTFNNVLRAICRKAGLNEPILSEHTEGEYRVQREYPKYMLVSSHTARRSGATNMYFAGILPFRIMLITGHATETSFFSYLRIKRKENAVVLQGNAYFTSYKSLLTA